MTAVTDPRPEAREVRIAAALIVAAGLAAAALAIFAAQLGLGAEAARDRFGWQRGALLVVGCAAAAVGALLLARPRIAATRINWERVPGYLSRLAFGLLVLLGFVLVWTRMVRIDQSFWHDEAFTVLNYSGSGPGAILFGAESFDINNHVAYNLLSWATASLLGETEATYRLWSVLPAITAIGVATWWAWRRIGVITAIAFAALAVAAPMHLEIAPQARGYGLALLAAILMLIAADRLTRAYSKRVFVGFLGAGLLGIWTLFIFAIAFVGQGLALLRWPRLRRPVVAVVGTAGILSIAFYAPVLGGVVQAGAEGETAGETISIGGALLLDRTLDWTAVPIWGVITRNEPAGWVGVAALALVIVAVVALWRRQDFGLALLLVVPLLFFNLVFAVTALETAERHQFLLLTHVLLLVAVGIAELARVIGEYRPLRPLAIGVGVLAVLALSQAAVSRQQDQAVAYEDPKGAAQIARWTGIEPIVTDTLRAEGLRYYLGDDLERLWPTDVEALLCDRRQQVVYIRQLSLPPEDWGFWSPASLDCAAERPSAHLDFPQRRDGTALDVWIVPRADGEAAADDPQANPGPD
jgi:hypothetical protein